jgi:hypothetical protein
MVIFESIYDGQIARKRLSFPSLSSLQSIFKNEVGQAVRTLGSSKWKKDYHVLH